MEINTEEIMRQIEERVEEKRKEGVYKEDLDKLAREVLESTSPTQTAKMIEKDLERNLHLANLNWNIEDHTIVSRGGLPGYFIIFFKKTVRFIVRPWIGAIIHSQALFNSYLMRILNSLTKRVERGGREVKHRLERIEGVVESRKIEKEDFPYFAFENKHRGSRKEIKERESIYLEYFQGCQNVLDIGCGRGEFLELLKENNIGGYGVDANEEMVSFCQKRGLNVQNAEGISHLMWLENDCLDGIFMDQVIEHLQPRELARIVKLSHEKLKGGTYFIAVTPNPISLVASSSFYVDLTHTRPVHWETMQFILESDGFRNVEAKFVSPVPEGVKLDKIDPEKGNKDHFDKIARLIEPLNKNIEKLNSLIYAPRDYAIIAMK